MSLRDHKFKYYLWSHRILDTSDSDTGQIGHHLWFLFPVWSFREVSVGEADCSQSVTSHLLNHFTYHLVSISWWEGNLVAFFIQDSCTSVTAAVQGMKQLSMWPVFNKFSTTTVYLKHAKLCVITHHSIHHYNQLFILSKIKTEKLHSLNCEGLSWIGILLGQGLKGFLINLQDLYADLT